MLTNKRKARVGLRDDRCAFDMIIFIVATIRIGIIDGVIIKLHELICGDWIDEHAMQASGANWCRWLIFCRRNTSIGIECECGHLKILRSVVSEVSAIVGLDIDWIIFRFEGRIGELIGKRTSKSAVVSSTSCTEVGVNVLRSSESIF